MSARILSACPFCGIPLTIAGGVNPYGRCDTEGCWMHARKISVPLEDPMQVVSWNHRAALPGSIVDIAIERRRQVEKEGWTPEHDDEHRDDLALPRAAAVYALAGTGGSGPFWITPLQTPQQIWPYRWEWKPKDRRSNLVRAGALIAAEIDRLDREAGAEVAF